MPEPESRRTALLKLKMDMVYRGLDRTKAEERFNQNVLPPPQEEGKASVSVSVSEPSPAPPPEPTK